MTEKNIERIISAALIALLGGGGVTAYISKPSVTVEEVVQELKDDASEAHHEFEMEDQRQMFEDISTKTRVTDLERNQALQRVILEDILEEVKE